MTRRFPMLLLLLAAGVLPGSASLAQGADCPTPPNLVTARVDARVEFDAASGLYRYTYTVTNDAASAQEIDDFSIDVPAPISDIDGPAGWTRGAGT